MKKIINLKKIISRIRFNCIRMTTTNKKIIEYDKNEIDYIKDMRSIKHIDEYEYEDVIILYTFIHGSRNVVSSRRFELSDIYVYKDTCIIIFYSADGEFTENEYINKIKSKYENEVKFMQWVEYWKDDYSKFASYINNLKRGWKQREIYKKFDGAENNKHREEGTSKKVLVRFVVPMLIILVVFLILWVILKTCNSSKPASSESVSTAEEIFNTDTSQSDVSVKDLYEQIKDDWGNKNQVLNYMDEHKLIDNNINEHIYNNSKTYLMSRRYNKTYTLYYLSEKQEGIEFIDLVKIEYFNDNGTRIEYFLNDCKLEFIRTNRGDEEHYGYYVNDDKFFVKSTFNINVGGGWQENPKYINKFTEDENGLINDYYNSIDKYSIDYNIKYN